MGNLRYASIPPPPTLFTLAVISSHLFSVFHPPGSSWNHAHSLTGEKHGSSNAQPLTWQWQVLNNVEKREEKQRNHHSRASTSTKSRSDTQDPTRAQKGERFTRGRCVPIPAEMMALWTLFCILAIVKSKLSARFFRAAFIRHYAVVFNCVLRRFCRARVCVVREKMMWWIRSRLCCRWRDVTE